MPDLVALLGPVCAGGVVLLGRKYRLSERAIRILMAAGAALAVVGVQLAGSWPITIAVALLLAAGALHQRRRIGGLALRLSDAARTDPLTGLLNRRALEELLEHELERARRTGRPLSILVGDLDGFRLVNERLGHERGDASLKLVAKDLEKWKRRIDQAARIGGEEFAVMLPETDERGAFLVAERLRRATHRTFADEHVPLTMSFGVATYPAHGDDAGVVLRAAEQAVRAAKEHGGDRTMIHGVELGFEPTFVPLPSSSSSS
jgi:diguanylate cyclase (GGDEF)-like protein